MASDGVSLTGLWFRDQRFFGSTLPPDSQEGNPPVLEQVRHWLDRYFNRENPGVPPSIALAGSPFQLDVWAVLQEIPYGQVITYGEIVRRLGKSPGYSQAVGGAVGRNPVSILVPCHRVVGANGSLTGYAGGLERKQRLLALEGVDLAAPTGGAASFGTGGR